MSEDLYDALCDYDGPLYRNYASVAPSQDLLDDLADSDFDRAVAQQVIALGKPEGRIPHGIYRPFEYTELFARTIPPGGFTATRYCDGSFKTWYGSLSDMTCLHESLYHWVRQLREDGVADKPGLRADRRLYKVRCEAMLVDLRGKQARHPNLVHATDYRFCHQVGARVQSRGQPGLLAPSVRHASGTNAAVFAPEVLSEYQDLAVVRFQLDLARNCAIAIRSKREIIRRPLS